MVKNITLVKIAAVGGMITVSMGYALRSKINDNIRQTEYYSDSMKILRSHKGAVHLLGEPIKDGRIDITNEVNNYTKLLSAHYEVPVRGPKQKGILYMWASRKTEIEPWVVNRLELGLKNEPDRRLLIKSLVS